MSLEFKYDTDIAFAAACAAMRLNNGYIKDDTNGEFSAILQKFTSPPKKSNRNLIPVVLADQRLINQYDRELASTVRTFCQGLTLKLLKDGYLSRNDQIWMDASNADSVKVGNIIELAASPITCLKSIQRSVVEERMNRTVQAYYAQIEERVSEKVEVLQSVYSHNYGRYYMSGITSTNHAIFFSMLRPLEVGATYSITGRVNKHRENFVTGINFVKVKQ
jgi:hypothetical protein